MQSDLPHTLYSRDKKKKKRGANPNENFTFNPNDPAIAKQLEANRRKKERMEKDGIEVKYTMDELFNKE